MPLEIYGEYDNWRRVRDAEGAGGWIHYSLLSGVRSIIVTSSMANLHRKSDKNAMVAGPLSIDSGQTLTLQGNLSIV